LKDDQITVGIIEGWPDYCWLWFLQQNLVSTHQGCLRIRTRN